MRKLNTLPIEILHEIFEYREDGTLYWRKTVGSRAVKGNRAGRVARGGYWVVNYKKKQYMLHRIVYAMHTGEWPPEVDHKNRARYDCRIENLRELSRHDNMANSTYCRSLTGFRGVTEKQWGRKKGITRFCARIRRKGRLIQIGYYKTATEASKAYEEKRRQLLPGILQ